MEKKLRVFLMGGDREGWALDTEMHLAGRTLDGTVDFVSDPRLADVVHTVWPEEILENPTLKSFQHGLPVVASFSNDPIALFERVPRLYEYASNWFCVGQSHDAVKKLQSLAIPFVRYVPYVADLEVFKPLNAEALRKTLGLPADKYIIGSFQRDSLGSNVNEFKPQKGADVFAAIMTGFARRIGAENMHVLLAGPRRHWLIAELRRQGVPYTFDGAVMKGDDYPRNILNHARINSLTNLINTYVVSSRWEGGPRAVMETVACHKSIISSDVGIARDILEPECIFTDISQAIDWLEQDYRNHSSALRTRVIERQHATLMKNHGVANAAKHWRQVYADVASRLHNQHAIEVRGTSHESDLAPRSRVVRKALFAISKIKKKLSKRKSVTLWGEMVLGPYGGASQVLKAISVELERRGIVVRNNSYEYSDGHILNSVFFDVEKCKEVIRNSENNPRVVHRIDGPISLYRGKDRYLDDAVFQLNREIATTTAFQCLHSWRESLKMGFQPVRPMIIRNACDPEIFYRRDRVKSFEGRKIKLITTSWSSNMNKGFDTYKHLDDTLDFSRYEYTFVGRSPMKFKNIKTVDAVGSEKVAEILRESDIFIAASLNDPASNALLEAINCGLPAVFAYSGGHAEFAWYAGLHFSEASQIPEQLEKVARDYESYRACAYSLKISEVVDDYLRALEL